MLKSLAVVVACLLLAGCIFEYPLGVEQQLKVDKSLAGEWIFQGDKGEDNETNLLILAFSDKEYLVHVRGEGEMYFKGYPIKVGKTNCVQLEFIGGAEGGPDKDMKKRYHVVRCQREGDTLEVSYLNSELVGKDAKSMEDMKKSFLENEGAEKLFTNKQSFKRAKH